MSIDRFVEGICVAAFLAAVGYGGGWAIGAVLAGMLRKKPNTNPLQESINRLSVLERGLANRVGDRRRVMAELDREIKLKVRRRVELEQATAKLLGASGRVLRMVGQEIKGAQPFLALVVNKYVKAEGRNKTAVDPAWASPQEVEVWAKSLGDARVELERGYPESQGFKIITLSEPSQSAGG